EFLFDVDTISGLVTPSFRISPDGNPSGAFTEMAPVQATGDVLDAVQGNFVANGVPHPLAFGNIGTSAIDPSAPAGANESENVNVTYDDFTVSGFAPQVDAFVSITDATVAEDGGSVELTVTLEDEFGDPITLAEDVDIAYTLGGDAQVPSDATVAPSAPLTIASGTSTASVTITINDDALIEGTETLDVALGTIFANGLAVLAKAGEDTGTVTITDNDVPELGAVLYRVNAGGPEIVATDGGPNWDADQGNFGTAGNSPYLAAVPTGGTTYNNGSGSSYAGNVESAIDVPASTPLSVFDTERGDRGAGNPTMQWAFPVGADYGLSEGDQVEVRLYFAEIFGGIENATNDADGDGTPAGNRVFDVAVDGFVPSQFDDIDQFAIAGPNTGFVRTYIATVDADGVLDLNFLNGTENPSIKAIEIVAVQADSAQDVTITAEDISADESTGEITVTFSISETVTEGDITVPFSLLDGTAVLGDDYFAAPVSEVTFEAGDSSDQTVVVTLVNDDLFEGDESFIVELGMPTAVPADVNVTTVNGTATIIDDDVAPVVDSFNGTPAAGDDWSGDNTAPDDVTLNEGANTLVATGAQGDADYITFTVAEGQQVTSITLTDYEGGGNAAFVAIQLGDSVPTLAEIEAGAATLDGGTVYNVVQEGQDILPLLASTTVENAGQPVNGLATPLEAGTYTLWFNQNQGLSESTLEIVSEAVVTTSPDDIDGDGILNVDDPFAYDGSNGLDRELAPGVTYRQDFDTPTANVFDSDGGFSGIIVNQDATNIVSTENDPYGNRTTEATTLIEDGVLKVTSSQTDLFGPTGANPSVNATNNNIFDNYQSAVDVSSVDSFSVEGKIQGGWLGTAPGSFASFGITLGAGGTDDYNKLVIGGLDDGVRFQMGQENSLTGVKEENIAVDAALIPQIASAIFRLDVDKSGPAPTLVGTVILLDASDQELTTLTTAERTITGSLAAALEGNNPLTNGTGGIAYGVSITDWGGAGAFAGEWDRRT
ncbi:MAG: Calx-beta domain-containing protein, partial [Planctomycetota bacterium]